MEIKDIIKEVMEIAEEKGFGTKPEEVNTLEKFALIHSEVSEALEAYRKKNINGEHGMAEELADVVVRVMHLAGIHGIDIEKEIINKIKNSKKREWNWKKLNETHT